MRVNCALFLLLAGLGLVQPAESQFDCPAIQFGGNRQTVLYDGSTITGAAQWMGLSYTGAQFSLASPYAVEQTFSNFQKVLLRCLPGPAGVVGTPGPAPFGPAPGAPSQVGVAGFLAPNVPGAAYVDFQQSVQVVTADGAFSSGKLTTYRSGITSTSVLMADFNGDGKMDLAVANAGRTGADTGDVAILIGKGDGTFQIAVNYTAGQGPVSIAALDLNGDGKLDLAVANSRSANVSVLLGKGDGTFRAPASILVGTGQTSVTAVDFNKDGKPDLAVTHGVTGQVSALLGNGDGTFRTPVRYTTGNNPSYVVSGDFNGDTKPDLAVADPTDDSVTILLGNADGTFQLGESYAVSRQPGTLIITDLNADGRPDIIVGTGSPAIIGPDYGSGSALVLLGKGDGTFDGMPSYRTGAGAQAVAVGDFDGDGRLDLATANNWSGDATILLGLGNGRFQSKGSIGIAPSGATRPMSVVSADFNGDSVADLAFGLDSTISILISRGNGRFEPPVGIATPMKKNFLITADFNGDGRPDLAYTGDETSTGDGLVFVMLGSGGGNFQAPKRYNIGDGNVALAAADFDGDGKLDLAVASQSSGGAIWILLGNGNGTFQLPAQETAAGTSPGFVAAADVNGDGWADLIAGTKINPTGQAVSVFLGKGDGTFLAPLNMPTAAAVRWISVADMNADGKPDLLIAHVGGNADMTFMTGRGDGTFDPEVRLAGGAHAAQIVVADLDRDRRLDLVTANDLGSNPSNVSVMLNATAPPPPLSNVSAASFQAMPLAAESIATAFGQHLATATAEAKIVPLPTNLAGSAVTVRDSAGVSRLAPLFYVSPGQINYLLPSGTANGTSTVTVTAGDGTSVSAPLEIATVSPGLFALNSDGLAAAGLLRVRPGNVQTVETVWQASSGQVVALPIDLGPATDQVYLILFGTGIRHRSDPSNVGLTIGGIAAPVLYAGDQGSFVGLDQVNTQLPRELAGRGKVDILLTVDGKLANTVNVVVK